MRNGLSVVVLKGSQDMVASIIRTIFAQPDAEHVRDQFDEVSRMLERSHPKVADMLHDAKEDPLAFIGFPQKHWPQIRSTNPLERVNKEILPTPAALLRHAGTVLVEQYDEWEAGDRRYFSEGSMRELEAMNSPRKSKSCPRSLWHYLKPPTRTLSRKFHHSTGRHSPG